MFTIWGEGVLVIGREDYILHILTFFLAYTLIFFLASILTYFLAYILAFYLASVLTFFLTSFVTFYLALCLAFSLACVWARCIRSWRCGVQVQARPTASAAARGDEEDERSTR